MSQLHAFSFQCSVCREVYTRVDNLQTHIKKHHTPIEGGVPCTKDYCQEVFETRYEMFNHRDGNKDHFGFVAITRFLRGTFGDHTL